MVWVCSRWQLVTLRSALCSLGFTRLRLCFTENTWQQMCFLLVRENVLKQGFQVFMFLFFFFSHISSSQMDMNTKCNLNIMKHEWLSSLKQLLGLPIISFHQQMVFAVFSWKCRWSSFHFYFSSIVAKELIFSWLQLILDYGKQEREGCSGALHHLVTQVSLYSWYLHKHMKIY